MKFAISLPNGGTCGQPGQLAEFASLADPVGWGAVFLEDYIIWQGHHNIPTFDSWVSLAAMAVRTKTIRRGTMVTPVARRKPWKLARETVSLDHLSGGRLILGVGVGETRIDSSFARFGEETDARPRAAMVDEALEVRARLWSGKRFTHDGRFYPLRNVRFLHRPLQRPRIPIWIGGVWPRPGAVRRALRWDGACLYKLPPQEEFNPKDVSDLAALARTRRKSKSPFDIVVGKAVWQREKDIGRERANVDSLAEAGATWWSMYVPPDTQKTMARYISEGPVRPRVA